MCDLEVRRIASVPDIPSIVRVFRDDPVVPWSKPDECAAWVARRAGRGFYMTGAYCNGQMAGYCEWVATYDRGVKILYLGIMQIDCELRNRGIGTAMLADGEAYAKSIGCSRLRTMPEDERSYSFYRKFGFSQTDELFGCICPAVKSDPPAFGRFISAIPPDTCDTHEFIFGLGQSSGRHMYEIYNHPPATDSRTAKSARLPGGEYLQLGHWPGDKNAYVLLWSNSAVSADTVSAILVCGGEAGFESLDFCFRSNHKLLFGGYAIEQRGTEIEKIL